MIATLLLLAGAATAQANSRAAACVAMKSFKLPGVTLEITKAEWQPAGTEPPRGNPNAPPFSVMFFGSLALIHAPLVVPLPSGGGGVEVAFLSGLAGDFGPGHQVTMLLLWRFYTTILLTVLGIYLLVRTHGVKAAKELFTVGWLRRRR